MSLSVFICRGIEALLDLKVKSGDRSVLLSIFRLFIQLFIIRGSDRYIVLVHFHFQSW